MKKPSLRAALTLAEAALLLSRLEKQIVSLDQVRAVLLLDTRRRVVSPLRHGETRLYTSDDVAAVRLVLRLRASGVSPTVARVVVACFRDELSQSWRQSLALAVSGLRGELLPIHAERPKGTVAWVPLREIWAGIEEAIRGVRKAQPEVWQWKPQPLSALTAETGR
jgi:DNA-binding transcriptional MerR regulator